jgi:hypothetical protein
MKQPMSPELSRRLAKAIQPLSAEARQRVYAAILAAPDEAALRAALPAVGVRV